MPRNFHPCFQALVRISLLTALLSVLPTLALAAPCPWVISPQTSQQLYDRLNALPPSDCRLADQSVKEGIVGEVWKKADESVPLHWSPRACTTGEDGRLQPLDLADFAQKCPQVARILQANSELADFPHATKPVPRGKTQVLDAEYDPVRVTVWLELLAFLGLLAWLGLAFNRRTQAEILWWQAGLALFALALLMRIAVAPSLSNWYTTVLGQNEVARVDRYGSGHIALQVLLRSALPWSDRVLFGANQLLGAAIVPLWLVVLRQRGMALRTAFLAAGLLAVLPLHVRLTNSASEHVLAAFFWLAALATWQAALMTWQAARVTWQAALKTRGVALALLATLLALLTALTRVDTTAPLLAIAAWTLLADRSERPVPLPRRLMATLLWLLVCVLALLFILPIVQVAVVEQGVPMPHKAERLQALHDFLPGMRRMLFALPGWIGPLVGVALLVGLLRGLRARPLLTLTAIATFLTIPAVIGRSPYDFIMMRYYLPLLPILTLFAALGLEPLLRREWVTPLLLVAIVALGWPAWHVRYAFQDEYDWLRTQLAQEPQACTVAQIGVGHKREFFHDLDCCLDLPRCPLVAELPRHTFVLTDSVAELQAAPGQCKLYYEGSVCALQPTADLQARNPQELKWFKRQCAELRQMPGLMPMAESAVTSFAHTDAFGGKPVHVRLYRIGR
jgi:hypothetical protein